MQLPLKRLRFYSYCSGMLLEGSEEVWGVFFANNWGGFWYMVGSLLGEFDRFFDSSMEGSLDVNKHKRNQLKTHRNLSDSKPIILEVNKLLNQEPVKKAYRSH